MKTLTAFAVKKLKNQLKRAGGRRLRRMKKLLICVLVFAIAAGTLFAQADPLGLTVYIDGFSFGDVAAEEYKFAGKDGQAGITPGITYEKSFGAIGLSTDLSFDLTFSDPLETDLAWQVKGTYELGLSDASALTFSLFNTLHLLGGPDEAGGDDTKGKFADTKNDYIQDEIAPGVRFDQKLGFGTLYGILEVSFIIHTQEDRKLDILTGSDDGFTFGIEETELGIYGYLQPEFDFLLNGESPDDVLRVFNIRAGYTTGPIDTNVTFSIPAYEDGIKADGLSITPYVEYGIIPDSLSAYLELEFSGLGADTDQGAKVGFTPTIGVSYSF
jgi:hypothetical protein